MGGSLDTTVLTPDGEKIFRYLDEVGFKQAYDRPLSEADEGIRETLMLTGSAITVADMLRESGSDIESIEVGGLAVFAQLEQELGSEAFEVWRGSHDSDKYLPDNGDVETALNLEAPVWKSGNDGAHKGGKYTADIELFTDEADTEYSVEVDFMMPPNYGEEEYTLDESQELYIGDSGSPLRVASVPKLLQKKLDVYGGQRDKDKQDVGTLLYIAEQRYNSPENVPEDDDVDYSPEAMSDIVSEHGLETELQESVDEVRSGRYDMDPPSSEYLNEMDIDLPYL